MENPSFMTKSFTIRGADGNQISVSETADRLEIVIAIEQYGKDSRIGAVRLNGAQFEALCGTRYSLEVAPAAADTPEAA